MTSLIWHANFLGLILILILIWFNINFAQLWNQDFIVQARWRSTEDTIGTTEIGRRQLWVNTTLWIEPGLSTALSAARSAERSIRRQKCGRNLFITRCANATPSMTTNLIPVSMRRNMWHIVLEAANKVFGTFYGGLLYKMQDYLWF